MKQVLEIPQYTHEEGLVFKWPPGDHKISVSTEDGCVLVRANPDGLLSLAQHLLTLAQDGVPTGNHLHLDDSNALEAGSVELILERM